MNYYVYHIHFDGMGLHEGYVGISRNPKERWRKHSRKNSKSIVSGKINKYKDDIRYTILAVFDTEDEARWLEYCLRPQKHIGWNIAVGGAKCPMDGIKNHSEETRKKMSKSHTGLPWSEERRRNFHTKPRKTWKLSKQHIEDLRKRYLGIKSPLSRPVNLYNFDTDDIIAENVVIRQWCRDNNMSHRGLYQTLKADHSKPSSKHNVRHSKRIYARYVEDAKED